MTSERRHKVLVTFFVVAPFLGVLLAIYFCWQKYVFPSDIILLVSLHLATALGETIGYHRMLTHQGFETHPFVRRFFIALGSMAFAGMSQPDDWAATHIKHHAHSDEEGDPHSPLDGFWHAHFGWLFHSYKHEGRVEEYAPHLLNDPDVQFVKRWWFLWTFLTFFIPFAIGGWTGVLWGGVVRLFVTEHTTWSEIGRAHV